MFMEKSIKIWISFGITSGIITTLWLIVWLESWVGTKMAVIWGILIIAIADSLSDALWILVSQESQERISFKSLWHSAVATFSAKFIFALTFIIPIMFFDLHIATIINVLWWLAVLTILTRRIAIQHNKNKIRMILLHLTVAGAVVILTYFVWSFIHRFFW